VSVDGFRQVAGRELLGAGFELTLDRASGPVAVTADTGRDMRVLRLPDDDP
jgi:hypothetical protein